MGPYFFNQNIKEDNMINKEDLEIIDNILSIIV